MLDYEEVVVDNDMVEEIAVRVLCKLGKADCRWLWLRDDKNRTLTKLYRSIFNRVKKHMVQLAGGAPDQS